MLSQTPGLSYETGVTRLFGNCDLGSLGFLEGWSLPEDAHIWNDGPEARLKIEMAAPRKTCHITFRGMPYLAAGCLRQDVTLFVNGHLIRTWRLTENKNYELSGMIEPEQFFNRRGRALVQCVWQIPNSVRPSDLGIGSDDRELGFCFRSLLIVEED